MIKASIVNHPFKEIKSVLHSRITREAPNRTRIKALISTSRLLDKITLFIRTVPFSPFFPTLTLCCSELYRVVNVSQNVLQSLDFHGALRIPCLLTSNEP